MEVKQHLHRRPSPSSIAAHRIPTAVADPPNSNLLARFRGNGAVPVRPPPKAELILKLYSTLGGPTNRADQKEGGGGCHLISSPSRRQRKTEIYFGTPHRSSGFGSAFMDCPAVMTTEQQTREGGEGGSSGQGSPPSSACTICGEIGEGSSGEEDGSPSTREPTSFALRCNSCRLWYHPWCLGYQLDLDRSCLITASEVDIPIDPATGVPQVCQWFCDSCASTVTGVVAATAAKRQRPSAGPSASNRFVVCGRRAAALVVSCAALFACSPHEAKVVRVASSAHPCRLCTTYINLAHALVPSTLLLYVNCQFPVCSTTLHSPGFPEK